MDNTTGLEIIPGLSIPESELSFVASHSSGPGGQNVNKVATKITLKFEVVNSPSLTDDQRATIMAELRTRINKEGVLRVSSQKHRTQLANRQAAVARFIGLLQEALDEEPPRVKTRTPQSAKECRLKEKKRRGRLKKDRAKVTDWDD